jgi:hypothetical protein
MTLKLNENLDVKVSGLDAWFRFNIPDFGVSVWIGESGEFKKKPFYIGEKGIYGIK